MVPSPQVALRSSVVIQLSLLSAVLFILFLTDLIKYKKSAQRTDFKYNTN